MPRVKELKRGPYIATGHMARYLSAILALFAVPPSASSAAYGPEMWFRIAAPDGKTIGWQRESREVSDGGSRDTIERQLSYRVDGHEPIRQYLKREIVRDTVGRVQKQSLMVGSDATAARSVNPSSASDEAPLTTILTTLSGANIDPNLQLVDKREREALVQRTRNGSFDAAWIVRLSKAGQPESIIQPSIGGNITFTLSPVLLGLADISPAATMPHAMVSSLYDISAGARRGHIRYGFGPLHNLSVTLPETGEQRATRTDGGILLDVCARCGAVALPSSEELDKWRKPSTWIESDAPEIRQAVARVARPGRSGAQTMAMLGKIARDRLSEVDYRGHYSARNAWKRRKGDCSEDATLLAALARASGLPSRVVSGLVYDRERYHGTRNAFLPHAWTIAWIDGAWRSFDISVGAFDATHIALAVGDGEPDTIALGWRVAALLEWQSMAEVRSASAGWR